MARFGAGGWVVTVAAAALGLMSLAVARVARRRAGPRSVAHAGARDARLLESIVENIPAMVFVKDATTLRQVLVNRAAEEIVGLRREDVVGKTDRELFPEEQARAFEEGDRAALATRALVDVSEERIRTPHRGERVLHTKKIPILDDDGTPRYVLGISEDVTELKRAREERERLRESERAARAEAEASDATVERTARRVRDVLAITETALVHLELRDLLRAVTERVRAVLGGDTVAIVLLSDDGSELQVVASLGLEDAVRVGLRFPANRGLAGRTLSERRAMIVDDISRVELASPLLRDRGVRSVLAAPLRAEGRAIGVLHVGTIEPRRFTQDEATLLQLIADRVGIGIAHARLYDGERRAREEAQRAVRAREELLAVVSHDLRNALSTISLSAKAAQHRLDSRGDGAEVLPKVEAIVRASEQMSRLIRDLLDSARIEAEGLSVARREDDAAAIVMEAERAARPLAEHKGVRMDAVVAPALPPVLCDRERVLQVLSNLLGNAVKFTPPGGRIVVGAEPYGGAVLFSVSDTGRGIPAGALTRIFERRWRADPTSREDSGLGLHIAKGIVDAHGGRIWVESREGEGSRFLFTLSPAPAPAEGRPSAGVV